MIPGGKLLWGDTSDFPITVASSLPAAAGVPDLGALHWWERDIRSNSVLSVSGAKITPI